MEQIEVLQGGEWVKAWVHDCGTVCLAKTKIAEPPYPPYMLIEWWCPTCKKVVMP